MTSQPSYRRPQESIEGGGSSKQVRNHAESATHCWMVSSLMTDFCRSSFPRALVKSAANDWSVVMQMGGQVRATPKAQPPAGLFTARSSAQSHTFHLPNSNYYGPEKLDLIGEVGMSTDSSFQNQTQGSVPSKPEPGSDEPTLDPDDLVDIIHSSSEIGWRSPIKLPSTPVLIGGRQGVHFTVQRGSVHMQKTMLIIQLCYYSSLPRAPKLRKVLLSKAFFFVC